MKVCLDIFQVQKGWMGTGCTDKGIGALILPHADRAKIKEELECCFSGWEFTQSVLKRGPFDDRDRKELIRDLRSYFEGERKELHYEVDWECCGYTDFQKKALMSTYRIPYGISKTYREVAEDSGHPRAYRAAGGAMNKNRIPLVVP